MGELGYGENRVSLQVDLVVDRGWGFICINPVTLQRK